MKINRIKCFSFGGARDIDITITSPLLLIYGHNGQGKSFTLNAIRSALLGKFEGLNKKDYGLVVSEGESKGVAGIETSEGKFALKVPSGNADIPVNFNELIEYCLDNFKFFRLKTDERKGLLFKLMNVSGSDFHSRLTSFSTDITGALPKDSIDNAYTFSKERISELRAEWKAITGEIHGTDKAEDWEPKKDNSPMELRMMAENLPSLKKELDSKKKSLDLSHKTLEQCQDQLDKAQKEWANQTPLLCVSCGEKHLLSQGILAKYVNTGTCLSEERIESFKSSLLVSSNAHEDLRKQCVSIQFEVAKCERAFEEIKKAHASVDEVKSKAYLKHKEILVWLHLEKALSPDGIKKDLLVESLIKINGRLDDTYKSMKVISPDIKWPKLHFNGNAELVVMGEDYHKDGTPFVLLSKSDQWKCSVILSECFAHFSGFKLLLIDEADILSPKDRGNFFQWVNRLGHDSVIVAMTAKEKMEKSPSWMQAVWIENGEVA